MWAYIKENQLQDPKNKQMIKCDDKLSKVSNYLIGTDNHPSCVSGYSNEEVQRVWDDEVFERSHERGVDPRILQRE